ncbi:MAG: hypothetical protein JKY95_14045 [Planctomycetaceae bacterium]|nr:hypothetical protein [Planctomycetaceae bacterium]
MTHEDENKDGQGGCCGGHNKHLEQKQPEKEKDGCCNDKDAEKEQPDTSGGGCCGGH